jgi:hypothetical protein
MSASCKQIASASTPHVQQVAQVAMGWCQRKTLVAARDIQSRAAKWSFNWLIYNGLI